MGLLNRSDSKIFRRYFREMCKLIGIQVYYQFVKKQEMTIHSEDNSDLSLPMPLNIIFDENPNIDTLNALNWLTEIGQQQPVIANLSLNTPHISVNARITVESIDGTKRPRIFRITKIQSDLEYPDAYTCALVPVLDQYIQTNDYGMRNYEKINTKESEVTSEEQPYSFIQATANEDTTPEEYKEWQEEYSFIDDNNSPFSG